nr:hypothetical protein [Tanacetum cinerariifolium]
MRTRSRSRSRNNSPQREASPAIVVTLRIELPFLEDQFQEDTPPESPMADNRTMKELLQAPTEGYEDAIVILEITANNFELKHGLINLVQNKRFFGHDKEDPHAHIRYFNKITSTMRIPNVPSSSIKLMLFPFSLEGAARIWLEKEPPHSIQTWDDLVSKFINQFFPPSKTTNLRNEITRFQQRFDESFYEAWERFNDLLRACLHHGFFELHQLDTFYNALNINDQDSLNSAAGGNFLDKMPRECLKIIESKSKVRQSRAKSVVAKVGTSLSTPVISSDVAELKDLVKALLLDKKNQSPAPTPSTTPAPVKAVESNCVTCGGAHLYQNCPATHENAYRDNIQEYVSQAAVANYNQGNTVFRHQMVANQIRPLGFPPYQNNQNNFNRGNNFNQNRGGNFNQSNFNPSSFNQGQLNRPQVNQAPIYQAPIPHTQRVSQTDFESYVKANDEILRNMQSQGQSTQNQCQNIQNQYQNLQNQMATLTDMMTKLVSANTASSSRSGTLPGNTITNPKEELKGITTRSGIAYKGPKTPSLSKQETKVTKDQVQTPSSQNTTPVQPSVIQSESQALVFEPIVAPVSAPMPNLKPSIPYPSRRDNEKRHLDASINLMPLSVWQGLSLPELTPTCMTLELADRSVSKPIGIAKDVSFKVGVFHFPADFVVVDFEPDPRVPLILGSEPSPPLPNQEQNLPSFKEELKAYEAQTVKSSVDEPPEVELKDLPHHLEYTFLEGDNKLPVIIAKQLGSEEKAALIKVLKSHKRA